MASIRERKRADGSITYAVLWREGGNGTQTSEHFPSRHDAELLRDYLDANGQTFSLAADAYKQSRAHGPTMTELSERHIKNLTGVTARTRKDYRSTARLHIISDLGHIRAGQLKRAHVKNWVNKLEADGVAPKSIANYHGLLSAMMNTAIDEGIRTDNPCKGMRLPVRDRSKDHERFLEVSEYETILANTPKHWRPVLELLAGTGVRWGEVTALTVGDVVFDKVPYVDINKAWKRGEDNRLYIDRPKTHRSFREVTIDQALADMLKELCKGRPRDAWVLTNTQGGPVTYRNFQGRVWAPAITRAMTKRDDNPEPLRFRPKIHSLRHSHGSWLVEAGVDLTAVSRRLGHENIQTTVNVYGHISQRGQAAAAAAYARVMNRT